MKIQPQPTQIYSSRPQLDSAAQSGKNPSADAKQVLLGKLAEKIPGMTAEKLSGLDANDYTPDKVAGRISDFVAAGLAAAKGRGASDERLQQMYDAAVKGVEKGFKEAREILDNLDVLKGDIKSMVDETETQTFDALAQIAPGSR